ncbi:U-box domain-containing protein 43 isoform X1 [Lactuca sativa]|uniref:non-specific serine/threonine protein kinase n=1 Tax=Lactuca sativa TaxID=4236 RepID=A0A9R1UEH4_LACSA|nr:U-box domain-containing protein 43 isoform X1 [Lactuca sativa]KAJ0185654.1 hypothetical protein LSAT_V11C900500910 [Lactuca sativa]
MKSFLQQQFQDLKHFNLKEIKTITGNFDDKKFIGEGGFGKVYAGVLSDSEGQIRVAFKRLSSKCGQGNPEFLKEIFMLSRYIHDNLISLVGFCDEDGEKILVYEHASNGSLDCHLSSMSLTWTQRLKICLGAARGLCYLHDPKETQQRVLHRDIKSSNILLDENWNAKVSDMGLSKIGPAGQQQSFLATNVVGTFWYIDPMYMETSILTKESDVYSFGVVLFEVLCGSLCFERNVNNNHFQSLVRRWKKSYKEKKLDEIIFHNLKQGMNMRSLETFSQIAYQCLMKSRVQRPKMCHVVEKLEIALQFQQGITNPEEFKEMVKSLVYKEELEMLLSSGIIINEGNTWFSLNKNGKHCEMISAECFGASFVEPPHDYVPYYGKNKSRFEVCNRRGLFGNFTAHVTTQFLSPNIIYKVNLVFMNVLKRKDNLGIKYKSGSKTNYMVLFVAHEREDGWLTAELYQYFVNDTGNVDLEIEFHCPNAIEVEGIEFLPLEKHKLLDVDLQTDTDWGPKLPCDYEDIIKWSKNFMSNLSLGLRSESDSLQALMFIQQLCIKNLSSKHIIRNADLIPMIVEMLKSTSSEVRCRSLETLRVVVEDDNDNKEIMADGVRVRSIVKFLSDEHSQEREEAFSLLYELSKSEALCEKIGSVNGAILILVGMTDNKSENISIVEKADKILKNLEKNENNVRQMAENGRLQPFLTLLLQGSLEIKLRMASYLGELSNNTKVFVARSAGLSLINLMKTGDTQSREAALKALNQVSSCETSAKVLVEQGILSPLIQDLFSDLPMRLKEVSATILANIVTCDCDCFSITVGPNYQTLLSEDMLDSLLRLISNSGSSIIEYELVQVLIVITNSPVAVIPVVNAIKSSGATMVLLQLIEAPHKDLRMASIKLLHNLSLHISQELANCLYGSAGQLSSLFKVISENIANTEEKAAAIGIVANLPEQDRLTRKMLIEGDFEIVVCGTKMITQGKTRRIRFMALYLEGLVSVLSRITFVLSDVRKAISFCRQHELAALFSKLVQENWPDKVQMASALALESLSRQSKNLTKLPLNPPPKFHMSGLLRLSKKPVMSGMCRVHRGVCTQRDTFCLLEGECLARLVNLLHHKNEKVVKASLAALSTLLNDGVYIEEGVSVLREAEGIKPILNVLLENQNESLRGGAVWMVERLLRTKDIKYQVSGNPNVSTALLDAFQHGDYQTRQIAERALNHIGKIPNFYGIYPNMG